MIGLILAGVVAAQAHWPPEPQCLHGDQLEGCSSGEFGASGCQPKTSADCQPYLTLPDDALTDTRRWCAAIIWLTNAGYRTLSFSLKGNVYIIAKQGKLICKQDGTFKFTPAEKDRP